MAKKEGSWIPDEYQVGGPRAKKGGSDYPVNVESTKVSPRAILDADRVLDTSRDPLGELLLKEKTGQLWEKKGKEKK